MANALDEIRRLMARNSRRLLNLYFPNGDDPKASFLVNHLEAHEQVSKDFTYVVTVLSDDPNIEPTTVQGRMVRTYAQRAHAHYQRFVAHGQAD